MDRIDIRDVETDKLYPFICERWLSKKKEEGKLQRTLYVKGYEVCKRQKGGTNETELSRNVSYRRFSRFVKAAIWTKPRGLSASFVRSPEVVHFSIVIGVSRGCLKTCC